jgi:hypothetical protein
VDELGGSESKVAYAVVDLAGSLVEEWGDSSAASGRVFEDIIEITGKRVGSLQVWTRPDRELGSEDHHILRALAALAGVGVSQTREHKDSMLRLATMAHGFGDNLVSARNHVGKLMEGREGDLNSQQRETLAIVKYHIHKVASLSEKVAYTVQVLSRQVIPDLQPRPVERLGELLQAALRQAELDAKHRKITIKPLKLALSEPHPNGRDAGCGRVYESD